MTSNLMQVLEFNPNYVYDKIETTAFLGALYALIARSGPRRAVALGQFSRWRILIIRLAMLVIQ